MLEQIQDSLREQQVAVAAKILQSRGVDIEEVKSKLAALEVEVPSWGFARAGTRFAVYTDGTEPQTMQDRLAAAGLCHKLTGSTPGVALAIPRDGEDCDLILQNLKAHGLKAGAINSDSFNPRQAPLDYRLRWGSLTNPIPEVRRAALDHHLDCVAMMGKLGSRNFSLWLHDGTNSAGQQSLFEQSRLLEESLRELTSALSGDQQIFVEYKFFEPGFYATAIADWGWAYALAIKLGERAKVLVDLGHHPLGTNIEQIVSNLQILGKLGGFHFNDKKYADDDLATGSVDPFQLFRIFNVLVEADLAGLQKIGDVAFMIDESHCLKDPLEEMIEAVDNIQRAYVLALSVDRKALKAAQDNVDAELGDQILKNAFFDTPANAILQASRLERGLPADPLKELRARSSQQRSQAVAR